MVTIGWQWLHCNDDAGCLLVVCQLFKERHTVTQDDENFVKKNLLTNWFFFIKTKTRRVFEVCLLIFGMTKKRFSHGESQANPYITRNKHPKLPPQNRPKWGLTGWKSSASRGCNNNAQCVCWAFFSVARQTKCTQDFFKNIVSSSRLNNENNTGD